MRLFGISFSEGNIKLGEVFSFSLPSIITCPGASSWCKKHCYAKRYERIRPTSRNAYNRNLVMARTLDLFVKTVVGVLPRLLSCMRIHTAGDFWSAEYVEAWQRICPEFPQTQFWAYTRSWVIPEILKPLEKLRKTPNIELFASVDPTMPLPPPGWRTAFIENDPRSRGLPCPEQNGQLGSCLSCGYCFQQHKEEHVIFKIH